MHPSIDFYITEKTQKDISGRPAFKIRCPLIEEQLLNDSHHLLMAKQRAKKAKQEEQILL